MAFHVFILTFVCIGTPQIADHSGPDGLGGTNETHREYLATQLTDWEAQFQITDSAAVCDGASIDEAAAKWIQHPFAGIVVSIDADKVFEHALQQSWSQIHDQLGKRSIKSRAFSKVNYQIEPVPSVDGALLGLMMQGVAIGESQASRENKSEIFVDTLTKFRSRQMLRLSHAGVEYGPVDVRATSTQSFNRMKSQNPFSTALVERFMKKPSQRFTDRANEFATKQIERNIMNHLAATYRATVNSLHTMQSQFPVLLKYNWNFSSDEMFIYVAADHFANEYPNGPVADQLAVTNELIQQSPVALSIREHVIGDLLNDHLANRNVVSSGIESSFDRLGQWIQMPPAELNKDHSWNISFGTTPADVRFEENNIRIEITTGEIASDKQSIRNMVIGFSFRPLFRNGFWYFVRDKSVEVRNGDDHGKRLGARQTAFRTVMRKRLQRVVPEYFALKKHPQQLDRHAALDLDLEIDQIQVTNGKMTWGFRIK